MLVTGGAAQLERSAASRDGSTWYSRGERNNAPDMKAQFHHAFPHPIINHFTEEVCFLVPVNETLALEPDQYAQIVTICNQPLVYSVLFADRLSGNPYRLADAERFIQWAKCGWQAGTHFVFLIRRQSGEIIGALDIKSNTLPSAEIGYWMSACFPGVMTNAVKQLVEIARRAGYQELFGMVRVSNVKSAGVLARVGFTCSSTVEHQAKHYHRFVLRL